MLKEGQMFLTDAQLKTELERCEYCAEKPCQKACPADCSPADFIMAARKMTPSDYKRSAAMIMSANPLGGLCGALCPDTHCQAACSKKLFDGPIEIPAVQATVVQRAKDLGVMPEVPVPEPNGLRVAVVGGGPSGLGAAALLARRGYDVTVMEQRDRVGGACRLVPPHRMDPAILDSDIAWALKLGSITVQTLTRIEAPETLLDKGFDGVVVAAGQMKPMRMGIPGEELALEGLSYLGNPSSHDLKGRRVAVLGAGATAVDCATTAVKQGALTVELVARRPWDQWRLTDKERDELLRYRVSITDRTRVTSIDSASGVIAGMHTVRTQPPYGPGSPDVALSEAFRTDVDAVILALGSQAEGGAVDHPRMVLAGDFTLGGTTVVTAVANGKNAAERLDQVLRGTPAADQPDPRKGTAVLPGVVALPVDLATDFFGRRIPSPFLLSAAPATDGYEQVVRAYQAGWSGAVLKTAFDGIPIHIPDGYMVAFNDRTYGNCDNVSHRSLDTVCRDIARLVQEWPDRLTLGSTGGSVTGNDLEDRRTWQANTAKLERAGAMGIEYSLSCPQGGDGTKGDIVSQDAELAAKIIGWVLESGDPAVPKLFKLTAAVTAIYPILAAIRQVLCRYPNSLAGVTLANSFPTLAFRSLDGGRWEEGVVVGMSGEGVTPISYLTLAKAVPVGVTISGNGGPMDYKAAADFLALGARSVQFCTVATKYGLGIIDELHSGLSHLMAARGMHAVSELIGCAQPRPITNFEDLTAEKKISSVHGERCEHCGNCTRCPYLAIQLGPDQVPVIDPARCIGCSICAKKCFAGALSMRPRTPEEHAVCPTTH